MVDINYSIIFVILENNMMINVYPFFDLENINRGSWNSDVEHVDDFCKLIYA